MSRAIPENLELRSALIQQLQSLAQGGILDLPKPNPQSAASQSIATHLFPTTTEPREEIVARQARPANQTDSDGPRQGAVAIERITAPPHEQVESADGVGAACSKDERIAALQVLQAEVAQCTRCTELVRSRTQTVFGVGNVQPRLCFFGEAPGADEDAQGEPFVGRAGQLLNKIIAACKMKREDVYILNAVKCRPKDNRTPAESEIENCWEYARRQLEILQPEFICCLGGVAVRALLKRKESIGKLRQKFFDYGRSQVIVTYHPAYLLREPNAKRFVWEDMQMLMKAMGISLA